MPLNNNIEITNNDIVYAEKTLLRENEHFDDERRDFIKNLDTIDLQAVPGSGKTTALLAKLIILERKMPFSNGSGILVLSHTNTAVDEIKDRLGKIAPKLFQFPNFIGTIQSFVDEFLTKPYGISFLGTNFNHIDVEYYENKISKKFDSIYWNTDYDKVGGLFYGRQINNAKKLAKGNTQLEKEICNNLIKNEVKKLFFDFNDEKIKLFTDYSTILADKSNLKYIGLKKIIFETILEGIISYDYAYHLGFKYLHSFPKIIKILQNRFQFVFVDEMQDMEKHQVDILEKIFYKKHVLKHCFQRIGDKNQAIYNGGEIKVDSEWKGEQRKELYLKGTHRLTKLVANVAKNFGVEFIDFDGQRILKDKISKDLADIKPIMLVYKTEHLNNENPECKENTIIKEFTKIIHEKKSEGYFSDVKEDKFICKAVIWNAKPQDDSKTGKTKFDRNQCRAKHYFFDYDVELGKSKNSPWLKTEKDYLFYYDKTDPSYKSKNHNIWRLLVRILRLNDIKNPETGKLFSRKETLLEFLKKHNDGKFTDNLLELKSKIYDWTKRLNDANIDEIAKEMDKYYFVDFIPSIFSGQITGKTIIGKIFPSNRTPYINIDNSQKKLNIFENNGIKVDIGTVHGVKGETHTCTLYLESSNHSKNESDLCFFLGKIEDEIKRIEGEVLIKEGEIVAFKGKTGIKARQSEKDKLLTSIKNIKSSGKMLYVGLSRSTHLLCYAIHEDRYNQLISGTGNKEKLDELWQIKELQP